MCFPVEPVPFAWPDTRFYRKFEDAEVFKLELSIAVMLTRKIDYEKPDQIRNVVIEARLLLLLFIAGLKGANDFQEHYTRYVIWCDAIINEESYYKAAAKWYKQYKREQVQH